ncbi:hypothetical protein DFJ73DRAFT_349404 [Zopfochytrium polystomum]|nr:hypothetical protein DFJ73DRAFT_349404 [Zopfochytrium polystomum]
MPSAPASSSHSAKKLPPPARQQQHSAAPPMLNKTSFSSSLPTRNNRRHSPPSSSSSPPPADAATTTTMPRAKSSSSRTSPSGHGSTSISRSPSPSSGIVRKRRHNFKLAVELRDYFEEPYGEFLDTLLSNPLLSASPNRYKIELHKRTAEQIAPRGFGWVLWISTETRQEFLAQKDRFCPNRTHSEFVVFLLLLSGNWKVPSAEMSESEEEAHSRSLTPSSASPASPAGSTPQLRPSSEIKQENLEECDSAATSSSDSEFKF